MDLTDANWITAEVGGSALDFELEAGTLHEEAWLSADFFNGNDRLLQLRMELPAGDSGRVFELIFGLYPGVQARLRFPATALAMNTWLLQREGALLKPMCGGDRVSPEEVSGIRIRLLAGPSGKVRWGQTPWRVTSAPPALIESADSIHTPLLDTLGQATSRNWPGKTSSEAAMVERIRGEAESAPRAAFPTAWSRWGGSTRHRFETTGFFHTHHDGRRWWLVDPDGCGFWSTGLDCVSPLVEAATTGLEHLLEWTPDATSRWNDARRRTHDGGNAINFLAANFIRAFGPETWREEWKRSIAAFMRRRRFNTIGNWSDWQLGRAEGLAYTRPLADISSLEVPMVFRDFPDVFHEHFPTACSKWAGQLRETRDDPAFIGYFITNEPTWAFASLTPAAGMLINTASAASRDALCRWLRGRYPDDAALSDAWDFPATFAAVREGSWSSLPQNEAFQHDTMEFSSGMASRLFNNLAAACRAVDPNHLNLGARFAAPPPEWLLDSLGSFDVFSFNSYSKKPRPAGAELSARLRRPVLIGEWHFGAPDVGLPGAALETVHTQHDRALAYRRYIEAHAAEPWCVGTHWFTLYDQSAIGRGDGEPYNCGFLDVCQREYTELAEAAQTSHECIYAIAAGEQPIATLPDPGYAPRLSL